MQRSGSKTTKTGADAVKVAQARRRQRLQQQQQTSPPTTTTDDVLNRSMEAGQDVQDLLASVKRHTTTVPNNNNNDPVWSTTTRKSPPMMASTQTIGPPTHADENTFLQSPKAFVAPKSALKQAISRSKTPSSSHHNNHTHHPPPVSFSLTDNNNNTKLDASYLTHPCTVLMVNRGYPTRTVTTTTTHTAVLGGWQLGTTKELIRVRVLPPSCSPHYLCIGDRVVLERFPLTTEHNHKDDIDGIHCLGVVTTTNNNNDSHDENQEQADDTTTHPVFDIAFTSFHSGSKAQQWTLHDTRSNPSIKVGRAGREEDTKMRASSSKPSTKTAVPIRCGHSIVLRNVYTGGILSVHQNDTDNDNSATPKLSLLTDAYLQPKIASLNKDDYSHTDRDPTLLTRLQASDRLVPTDLETFAFVVSHMPPMNEALFGKNRYLEGSYLWHSARAVVPNKENDLPPEWSKQERLLVNELIGACMGWEGVFVRAVTKASGETPLLYKYDQLLQFELVDSRTRSFDSILRTLVHDMLELPTCVARVRRFVGVHLPGYEYGSVMQCFCNAVRLALEQHVQDVVEWNNVYQKDGGVSLRQLVLQAKKAQHKLSVLNRCCDTVWDKKGGDLLNSLRHLKLRSFDGDNEAAQTIQSLLNLASVPYMTWLCDWLDRGKLPDDPLQEFMVQRDDTDSWESNYSIVPVNVLEGLFATEFTVQKVLTTGRYWNVLQSSSKTARKENQVQDGDSTKDTKLLYASSTASVSAFVDERYQSASTDLVQVFMKDYDLMGSLRIMKHFFLLEYGDFFVDFLDKAEDEMLKDLELLSRQRIQNWMVSSMQLLDQRGDYDSLVPEFGVVHQSTNNEKTPTGLRCRFSTEGLAARLDTLHAASGGIDTHEPWTPKRHAYGGSAVSSKGSLTGLDTFFLEFTSIPYPISLILSPKSMECYQLLFRHLFFAKHVERRLVTIWKDHQALKELQALRGSMGPTFLLRQRMLHFVQNLIYYMMFEVIEPNWLAMESAIKSPKSKEKHTMDNIIQSHNQFLHRALGACLLTNRDIVRALTKLMKTCLLFTEQMKRFMRATKIDEERRNVATKMQRTVQHNLNTRGGGRTRSSKVSAKYLKENLQHARAERQKRVERQATRVNREVSSDAYQCMVTRFEEVFSKNLRDFMAQLTNSDDLYHSHKVNLCIRLDYNGHLTQSLGLI